LQTIWEAEVLKQFAPDGGNREQALNYQLYSWELCWHARNALLAAGREIAEEVEMRLRRAADFFTTVQVERDPWDYGDSDDAFVLPFMIDAGEARTEWFRWFNEPSSSPGIRFWLGEPPDPASKPAFVRAGEHWMIFPESGIGVCWEGDWVLRWDLSPLGYLSTAAHGHLDALHLSIWNRGVAFLVDPGTGAYYGNAPQRNWLASWGAHNGPVLVGQTFPRRMGPFLWREQHETPSWRVIGDEVEARVRVPEGFMLRAVARLAEGDGWRVDDSFEPGRLGLSELFTVRWQFAPGCQLEQVSDRIYRATRNGVSIEIGLDASWRTVEARTGWDGGEDFSMGACSPGFRQVTAAPCLVLTGKGHNPCVFRTTFLASSAA
jgi:hypothetical protein